MSSLRSANVSNAMTWSAVACLLSFISLILALQVRLLSTAGAAQDSLPPPLSPAVVNRLAYTCIACSYPSLVPFCPFFVELLQMSSLGGFIPLQICGFVFLFSINAVVRAASMWCAHGAAGAAFASSDSHAPCSVLRFSYLSRPSRVARVTTSGPCRAVPLGLRSMACSVDTVLIHVFGDIPSPPIVGRIEV